MDTADLQDTYDKILQLMEMTDSGWGPQYDTMLHVTQRDLANSGIVEALEAELEARRQLAEAEAEAEEGGGIGMADLGIGGGPTGFRRSFGSFGSFDSSSLLVISALDPFTRPPDALISLSKALNPAGRLGGGEEEEGGDDERPGGL